MMQQKINPSTSRMAHNFAWASGGPQNGGKMTGMDIVEFRDINSADTYNKILFK